MRAMNVSELAADALLHGGLLDGFIACPLRTHAVEAELCLLPDLHRKAQQTSQVWSSCHPRALAERGPIVHEVTALLEKVAPAIGGLDRIGDSVGEGLLYDVVRGGGRLGGPVSEARTGEVVGARWSEIDLELAPGSSPQHG